MKISISYRNVQTPHTIEAALEKHYKKIEKLLQTYEPDLVQLHGGFEKLPHGTEVAFSLNLSLPTGVLHATGEGPDPRASAHKAFSELAGQIKKHQSRLRKDYEWKRKRERTQQALA